MSQTVERAVSVLAVVAATPEGATVAELARELNMSAATASRLVRTLMDSRFLRRPNGDRRIRLGSACWGLGGAAVRQFAFRETVLPALSDFTMEVGRVILLAAAEDDHVAYLDSVEPAGRLPRLTPLGTEAPLHATAVGKAVLAFSPSRLVKKVVAEELEVFTPQTIDRAPALLAELQAIRDHGIAFARGEWRTDGFGIAVPILVETGFAVGAVGAVAAANECHKASPIAQSLLRLSQSLARLFRLNASADNHLI